MNEFDVVRFHNAVGIADSELMLIDQEPVRGRLALEQSNGAFDSPGPSDERTGEEGDDAEMRDQEGDVMFLPRPARKRRDSQVRDQKKQLDWALEDASRTVEAVNRLLRTDTPMPAPLVAAPARRH